ncbi:MAG TPA: hypothetical protein VGN23_05645 [Verrucomicrobiae bacterium]|jgi:hypothetical protein
MNKKNYALIGLVLVLAAVYVVYFTDWFRSKPIIISHTSRPMGRTGHEALLFSLGGDYSVTEIEVVPLDEWQTNRLAQPLWHVKGDGTDPVNHFAYGQRMDGLDPVVDGTHAESLQPGVKYRIFVSGDSRKGSHDFLWNPPAAAPERFKK